MYRTTALAAQALTNSGVENPRDHILVYQVADRRARREPGHDARQPRARSPPPTAPTLAAAGRRARASTRCSPPTEAITPCFAELAAPGGPGPAVAEVDEDISPPTDNRPFFFQMADLDTFLEGEGFARRLRHPAGARPRACSRSRCSLLAFGLIVLPLLLTTQARPSTRGHAALLHLLRRRSGSASCSSRSHSCSG